MAYKWEWRLEHLQFIHKAVQADRGVAWVKRNWPSEWQEEDELGAGARTTDAFRPQYDQLKYKFSSPEEKFYYKQKNERWTEEMKEALIEASHICEGNLKETTELYNTLDYPNRTVMSLTQMISRLQQEDRLPMWNTSRSHVKNDWIKIIKSHGFEVLEDYGKVSARKVVKLKCDFGHTFEQSIASLGEGGKPACGFCAAAGSMSLAELEHSEYGKIPCKLYIVKFIDAVKVGITSKTPKERGGAWPDFTVLELIETTYFHARRIEAYLHNSLPRIPMYEPLRGNGGTECFELNHEETLLKLAIEEKTRLFEDAKNNT
jgi:hypothetical protein